MCNISFYRILRQAYRLHTQALVLSQRLLHQQTSTYPSSFLVFLFTLGEARGDVFQSLTGSRWEEREPQFTEDDTRPDPSSFGSLGQTQKRTDTTSETADVNQCSRAYARALSSSNPSNHRSLLGLELKALNLSSSVLWLISSSSTRYACVFSAQTKGRYVFVGVTSAPRRRPDCQSVWGDRSADGKVSWGVCPSTPLSNYNTADTFGFSFSHKHHNNSNRHEQKWLCHFFNAISSLGLLSFCPGTLCTFKW